MFQAFFVQPIFNILVIIYDLLPRPDLGVAVLILVIIVRLLLWPIFTKGTKSQLMFAKLQPEIERIQKKIQS
jgi:membrane protein insertase Oxa1/YidC/SpoIIIJ